MNVDRLYTLLVGILVVGFVVPTGAVVTDAGGQADVWADDDIVLEVAPGPHGEYATIGPDGNLTVDLRDPGLNIDAVTVVDRIFVINNTGDNATRVWLTDNGASAITLTNSATGQSLEERARSQVLEPNGSIFVGIRANTHDETLEAGERVLTSITLHATSPEGTPGEEPRPPTATPTPTTTGPTATPTPTTTGPTATPTPTTPGSDEEETVEVDFGPELQNVTPTVTELSPAEVPEPPGDGDPTPTAIVTGPSVTGQPTPVPAEPTNITNGSVDAIVEAGTELQLSGDQSLIDSTEGIDRDRRIVKAVDISVPQSLESTSASVRMRLNRSRLGETAPESARIGHRTEHGWQLLDTRVISTTDRSVVLETTTPGFSVFAVFVQPAVSYTWTLPDGSTFDGSAIRSQFDSPGFRNISLTVTDSTGLSSTTQFRILVNDKPRLQIDAPPTIAPNESTTLRANVSNMYGNVSLVWTLPDGRQLSGESVSAQFPRGEHVVALRATDSFGSQSRIERTIAVGIEPGNGGSLPSAVVSAAQSNLRALLGLFGTLTIAVAYALWVRRRPTGTERRSIWPDVTLPVQSDPSPEIVTFEDPRWNATQNRFEIADLEVYDAGSNLETVEILVERQDGTELARKTIDMRGTDHYSASPERIPGAVTGALSPDGRYVARVRAVDTAAAEGRASKVISPVGYTTVSARQHWPAD